METVPRIHLSFVKSAMPSRKKSCNTEVWHRRKQVPQDIAYLPTCTMRWENHSAPLLSDVFGATSKMWFVCFS